MLVPMRRVRIVGHRRHLDAVLAGLHRLRAMHLVDVTTDPDVHLPPLALDDAHLHQVEELRYLRARIDAILALLPDGAPPPRPDERFGPEDLGALRAQLEELAPEVEALVQRLDALEQEQTALPRYVASLRRLLPLAPELTQLAGYETVALLVESRHAHVLGDLNRQLAEAIGDNYEIISDQVDADTVGAILVFARGQAREVHALLGRGQVSRVRLPPEFESVPFRQAVAAMERRLAELPVAIASAGDDLDRLVRPQAGWGSARAYLDARIEQQEAARHLGATTHTFVVTGWVPDDDVERLRAALEEAAGAEIAVEDVAPGPDDEPPVLMRNPAPARPFESLVRLLAVPRYGALDPTVLMMIFLPLFFGMMLGDVAYGAILLVLALWVGRRFGHRSPVLHDLARVFILGAGWTVVWGVIYGEFLGDLGRRWFGMEPLWINREEALEPLLAFALAVGAAHIVLGLLLGLFEAARERDRRVTFQRLGLLAGLSGLFLLVAVAAEALPAGFTTPAVAAIVVGLVLLMALEGPMGLLLGPLALLGAVGNVLSYLRIAAIGLASVYLARVANELGATAPLVLGVLVAALFHALNLALGAFSPTIQALRLHYVEFFGKFFEDGGIPFRPFGQAGTMAAASHERKE